MKGTQLKKAAKYAELNLKKKFRINGGILDLP
jgi:hypothetical protein